MPETSLPAAVLPNHPPDKRDSTGEHAHELSTAGSGPCGSTSESEGIRHDLTRRIAGRAERLGLDLFGVCSTGPVDGWAHYARWSSEGMAGEMHWLTREPERRRDPRAIMPSCRSVVAAGMLYRTEHNDVVRSEQPPGYPAGLVARYARGEDYHHVLKDRLRQLLTAIREECGAPVEGMAYTDTGPLLERDLAYAAGLGWRAKNTHLIHQNIGSYFFLGELLLALDLTPGQPQPERCGSCQRCLDACPTRAFLGPGVLDARRCISYLTIELKGPIPRQLRPNIGQMVFGCDICQEVCPWNRHAPVSSEPAYRPITGASPVSLVELLRITPTEFSQRFRHSPLKRTKRRGIARNAAVALGNSGDPSVAPALCDALEDAEPLVRGHAAWALGRLGALEAMPALERRLLVERDTYVREELSLARDNLANVQAGGSGNGPRPIRLQKKPT